MFSCESARTRPRTGEVWAWAAPRPLSLPPCPGASPTLGSRQQPRGPSQHPVLASFLKGIVPVLPGTLGSWDRGYPVCSLGVGVNVCSREIKDWAVGPHRPMAEPRSEAVSAGPNTAPCVGPEPGEGAPRRCQDVTPICSADAHVAPNLFTRGQRGPPSLRGRSLF